MSLFGLRKAARQAADVSNLLDVFVKSRYMDKRSQLQPGCFAGKTPAHVMSESLLSGDRSGNFEIVPGARSLLRFLRHARGGRYLPGGLLDQGEDCGFWCMNTVASE